MARSLALCVAYFAVFVCIVTRAPPVAGQTFLRGDVTCDGCVSLHDVWVNQEILFSGAAPPCDCQGARDVNDDGALDLQDTVALASYLVLGGTPPPAPFPACAAAPGSMLGCAAYPACPVFKRGDANQDGCVNAADATFLLAYLNLGGPAPGCLQAADADDDDMLSTSDVTAILNYCTSGAVIPAPGPIVAGDDPTPGVLTCVSYPASACCSGCPNQLAGDCNQDGTLDLSDAVCLFGFLFLGAPAGLPCASGDGAHPSNIAVFSVNGDGTIDISDGVYVLQYLFTGGAAPAQGTACFYVEACPTNAACPACP